MLTLEGRSEKLWKSGTVVQAHRLFGRMRQEDNKFKGFPRLQRDPRLAAAT